MSKIAIIGSGIGGLTAGCLLAKQGHDVTIFESHVAPGGYTAGFWRNGFYFESGTWSFEASTQVFAVMKKLGVYGKVEFVPQRSRYLADDFDFTADDFDQFKQALIGAFPADRANLERYFAAVDPMVKSMRKVIAGGSATSMLTGGLGMVRPYFKYRKQTITEFTAGFFARDSKLYRMFIGFGYPDMSAWILGGAFVSFLQDYWTVKGGMQSWADALANVFQEAGGTLKLRTRVDKILTRNGAAAGVFAAGREHDADWVISASDYKKTFLTLLDNPQLVPASLREKISTNAVSEGIVAVYLGLRIGTEELRSRLKLPHVWCFDERPGYDVKNSADPEFFAKSSLGLYSPSLHDPRLAPSGKSSLILQAMAPYRWQDNWGGSDREKYRRLKAEVQRTLIAKAAKVIPGLDEKIEFADAATPRTFERYTGNCDGATSAWSWNPNNKFYRSMMKTHFKTPVPRLLIGSCWATQIGGVPGALGAAQACAKHIGRE